MRILITGSRNFNDFDLMKKTLKQFKNKKVTIVHGDCRGADKIAGFLGKELGFNIEPHPADWKKYGKSAGPIRNTEMVNSNIDLVLAFPVGNSKGTKDCLEKARRKGISTIVVTE